ncbi:hypothetical protein DFH08DRAFT_806174 [Mycena albidolilacea]|uniref:Uncharacterized protein n=1 Tax=Mycena albidolilacea TaxID=1033008 RepID=A0AAD7A8N5_9AGAR|nr:hypothetical protein DFH08DRAFT_806174 [Mycena albidolilacea]
MYSGADPRGESTPHRGSFPVYKSVIGTARNHRLNSQVPSEAYRRRMNPSKLVPDYAHTYGTFECAGRLPGRKWGSYKIERAGVNQRWPVRSQLGLGNGATSRLARELQWQSGLSLVAVAEMVAEDDVEPMLTCIISGASTRVRARCETEILVDALLARRQIRKKFSPEIFPRAPLTRLFSAIPSAASPPLSAAQLSERFLLGDADSSPVPV